jgi:pimeloyl-ACP methyl ester carboxylesterase
VVPVREATVQSRFTENGETRIHYLDAGGPDRGAPIIFVPGMTDVAADYVEIMPLLGRRTVVVEIRGHGRSDAPESGYDLITCLATMAAHLKNLGMFRGLGGFIAYARPRANFQLGDSWSPAVSRSDLDDIRLQTSAPGPKHSVGPRCAAIYWSVSETTIFSRSAVVVAARV